jgi:hypothetical protein
VVEVLGMIVLLSGVIIAIGIFSRPTEIKAQAAAA